MSVTIVSAGIAGLAGLIFGVAQQIAQSA